jgi:hypothetical protein
MQLASDAQIPDGVLAARVLLNEKPRLGFRAVECTVHQGLEAAKYLNRVGVATTVVRYSWQVSLKAQQQTANAASSQAGSMKYSINGTTISGGGVTYGKGTNKCNEFACDSVQSGTGYRPQVPKSGILGWLGFTRDPTAKEWATMAIPGYSGPLPLSVARPGDVIAMGHHDDNEGHVGIYVGNGRTASANFYQGGRITVNDWGFRGPGQNGEHPGDAGPVVRQWVGLP